MACEGIEGLGLIDVSNEDDSLLSPAKLDDFPFVSSPISFQPANRVGCGEEKPTEAPEDVLEQQTTVAKAAKGQHSKLSDIDQNKRKRKGSHNLRKSLAWNQAFFTSEGVLDNDELSLLNASNTMLNDQLLSIPEDPQERRDCNVQISKPANCSIEPSPLPLKSLPNSNHKHSSGDRRQKSIPGGQISLSSKKSYPHKSRGESQRAQLKDVSGKLGPSNDSSAVATNVFKGNKRIKVSHNGYLPANSFTDISGANSQISSNQFASSSISFTGSSSPIEKPATRFFRIPNSNLANMPSGNFSNGISASNSFGPVSNPLDGGSKPMLSNQVSREVFSHISSAMAMTASNASQLPVNQNYAVGGACQSIATNISSNGSANKLSTNFLEGITEPNCLNFLPGSGFRMSSSNHNAHGVHACTLSANTIFNASLPSRQQDFRLHRNNNKDANTNKSVPRYQSHNAIKKTGDNTTTLNNLTNFHSQGVASHSQGVASHSKDAVNADDTGVFVFRAHKNDVKGDVRGFATKPSRLRQPSPKLGFFDSEKYVRPVPSSNLCKKPASSYGLPPMPSMKRATKSGSFTDADTLNIQTNAQTSHTIPTTQGVQRQSQGQTDGVESGLLLLARKKFGTSALPKTPNTVDREKATESASQSKKTEMKLSRTKREVVKQESMDDKGWNFNNRLSARTEVDQNESKFTERLPLAECNNQFVQETRKEGSSNFCHAIKPCNSGKENTKTAGQYQDLLQQKGGSVQNSLISGAMS